MLLFLNGAPQLVRMPARAGVNCDTGDCEAYKTNGERPGVGTVGIEKIAADPRAEGAAEAEADFQKTKDNSDFPTGKDIADDGAVGWIPGAMADAVKRDCEINEPQRGIDGHRDHSHDAERRDQGGHRIRIATAETIREGAPNDGCADPYEADKTEVKRCREFFVTDGNKVGDGMSVDQEQSGAESEVTERDTPKWKRTNGLPESPVALACALRVPSRSLRMWCRVSVGKLSDVLWFASLEQRVRRK